MANSGRQQPARPPGLPALCQQPPCVHGERWSNILKSKAMALTHFSLQSNTGLSAPGGSFGKASEIEQRFLLEAEQLRSRSPLAGFNRCVLNRQLLCNFNIKHKHSV